MTVIAATAALPTPSPGPGLGALGLDQGFDALLAVVNGIDDPAPAKPAAHHVASKPTDRSEDRAERTDSADRADGAAARVEEAMTAAPDEDSDEAECEDSDDACQADAAAQAAAMLIAAMIPPADQTFPSEMEPEAEVAAPLQASLVSALADGSEQQLGNEAFAAMPQNAVQASDGALDVVTPAAPVSVPAPTLAGSPAGLSEGASEVPLSVGVEATKASVSPASLAEKAAKVALPGVDGTPAASLAAATQSTADAKASGAESAAVAALETLAEAQLDAPIAADEVGLDVASRPEPHPSKLAAPSPSAISSGANGPTLITATTLEVPLEAAPLVVASAADSEALAVSAASAAGDTAAAAEKSTVVVAQSAADPAVKVATVAQGETAAQADGHAEIEPVRIAGVEAGAPSGQGASDQGETGQKSSQGDQAAAVASIVANDIAEPPEAPILAQTSTTSAGNLAAAAPAQRAETRGSPETVAQLSAEILKKLDARTTRFDVALTPEGLGKVDVRIEIGRHGALTASMAFDTAQAAAELRGKANELRQALSQAGFTIADNALRFDVSSQGGQSGQNAFFNFNGGEDGRRAWSGKAFQAAQNDDTPLASVSDLLPGLRVTPDSGLDIRI